MRKIKTLILLTSSILFYSTATGQLISKKESIAIENILRESSQQYKPNAYLIQNVSILTMKDSQILENQSVLIENGVIQKIGSDIENQKATIIDGTGKFLMPGLTDMHVHLFDKHPLKNTWMLMLLLNGVTSVRDMCGQPEKLQLREKIKNNEILAPNLYQAGPIINGVKDNFGLFAVASTPDQARELVIKHKKSGYDFIKVYDALPKDAYLAILDEAQKQQMLVAGHLPDQTTLEEALNLNHNSIEHLTGYFKWKNNQVSLTAPENYAVLTASSNVWNCPTIYNHFMNGSRKGVSEMMNYTEASGLLPHDLSELWKKRMNNNSKEIVEIVDKYGTSNFESLKQIVLNLYNSKSKLIAGTDSGNLPFLIPGYSLHQELQIMNEIGIPTYEVLKMTTVNAALALNKDGEFGTVQAGKRADLLLLNGNPLENLANIQNKDGLMIRGIWLSKEELNRITEKIKTAFSN
jgi:imidazolonepropionase-like amidohydrolase